MTGKNCELIKTAGIILMVGLCYFVWIKTAGIYIPCMFRLITGFKCPGCGITTMITALVSLDFEAAFNANPFLFVTAPLLCAENLYTGYMSDIHIREFQKYMMWGLYAMQLLCVPLAS